MQQRHFNPGNYPVADDRYNYAQMPAFDRLCQNYEGKRANYKGSKVKVVFLDATRLGALYGVRIELTGYYINLTPGIAYQFCKYDEANRVRVELHQDGRYGPVSGSAVTFSDYRHGDLEMRQQVRRAIATLLGFDIR